MRKGYISEFGSWDQERQAARARLERKQRRADDLAAVNELPTLSQRVIGRVLHLLG